MKYTLSLVVFIALLTASAFGMVGGPTFVVPMKMTSMSVCGSQWNSQINMSDGAASQPLASSRLSLVARYGLLPQVDVGGEVGTANMNVSELGSGYSDFDADWNVSWGASARIGLPLGNKGFQLTGALNYFGFQPSGKSANEFKSISTKYMWHELAPSVTAGYRLSNVVPYVGVMKPYLFGTKETNVSFNGAQFPSAGGQSDYRDGQQDLRGLFGLEWKFPDGYSVSGEAATTSEGDWTLSIALTQMMR